MAAHAMKVCCALLIAICAADVQKNVIKSIDTLAGASVASNDRGNRVLVAWAGQHVYGTVVAKEDLVSPDLEKKGIVLAKDLNTPIMSVHTAINNLGSLGLVLWSQYVSQGQNGKCMLKSAYYDGYLGVFGGIKTLTEFQAGTSADCQLSDLKMNVGNDGRYSNIVYKQPDSRHLGQYGLVTLVLNGNVTTSHKLCCNTNRYITADDQQFAMASSPDGSQLTVGWVDSNGTNSSVNILQLKDSGVIGNPVAVPVNSTAKIDVDVARDAAHATVIINQGTLVQILMQPAFETKWNEPFYLPGFNGTEENSIVLSANGALIPETFLVIQYQLQSLDGVAVVECVYNLLLNKCARTNTLHLDDTAGTDNEVQVVGDGDLAVSMYSIGMDQTTASTQQVFLSVNYINENKPFEFILDSSASDRSFCDLQMAPLPLTEIGMVIAQWTVNVCEDCTQCASDDNISLYIATYQTTDGTYSCSAGGQCVEMVGGTFPSKVSCELGCVPEPSPGWACVNNECVETVGNSVFPSLVTCDVECYMPAPPAPAGNDNGKHKLSAGSVLLLLFFMGLVLPYLVGGAIFMRTVKGARGIEMVPHLSFWTQTLPGLIGDGVRFCICRPIKGAPYHQI
eukprot:TRINITY_DN10221_c0_g1_i1.p2 TRINITY_DN10221_c0_g1~~TRINITY_DN10221_c0_g1_i1.p2  ORF type:complete len:622 (+),score=163.20 TRINITY_DN10221_c0_g1_i1:1986-3851(+)